MYDYSPLEEPAINNLVLIPCNIEKLRKRPEDIYITAQWIYTLSWFTYMLLIIHPLQLGIPYTVAKLAICYCVLHFGYWSLDWVANFAIISYTTCFLMSAVVTKMFEKWLQDFVSFGNPADCTLHHAHFLETLSTKNSLSIHWYVLYTIAVKVKEKTAAMGGLHGHLMTSVHPLPGQPQGVNCSLRSHTCSGFWWYHSTSSECHVYINGCQLTWKHSQSDRQ